MNIHEHQAKELLRQYNIPTPTGYVAFTIDEAMKAAKNLPGPVFVVKAQIHAGGRGKAGGVKVVKDLDEVKNSAEAILGKKLIIKNVNSKILSYEIQILKKMGVKILFLNKKIYKGEPIADILVSSPQSLRSINCPSKFNSNAIDEFLVIFLIAAKAKGVSLFKNLQELNKKESPRLKWGSKILKMMGIKVITTKNSIKIFGNPQIEITKKITIQKYLKDHRVFMTSVIAALSFGGEWHIHDKDSIQTSFPSFLKIVDIFKNEK